MEAQPGGSRDFGKLRLQVSTLLSFLSGGLVGVVLYRAIGGYLPIATALILVGIAISAVLRSRQIGIEAVATLGD